MQPAINSNLPDSKIARTAVKLFFAITEEWKLTDEDRCNLAGVATRSTLHNWRSKLLADEPIKLPKDTLERLSYIAGIYKALQILFADPDQWKIWVHKPNSDFGGQTAMQRMLAGRVVDLADVRRYLDGWRGEHFA